jgi:two-component system sensor histidine kinase/response regulator
MVTAYGREEVIRKVEEAHLDGFLIKPINQSLLFDTIMNIFGKEAVYRSGVSHVSKVHPERLAAIRGAHVLLVEDNALNQEVGTELLRAAGLKVTVAGNGREGVEKVLSGTYDCVLMDIQMPEMDGLEATRLLRRHEHLKDLPIIAMTAHAMLGDREKSLEAGMNDHVTKPVDPDEIYGALLRWIKPGEREYTEEVDGTAEESRLHLPDLPGVDVAEGLRKVAGNRKVYLKVLKGFFSDYRDAAAALGRDVEGKRVEEARRAAHTIKGVAGNIGARALFGAARDLETALKEDGREDLPSLLESFEQSLAEVVSGLEALVEPSDASVETQRPGPAEAVAVSGADPEEMKQVLGRMLTLLQEGDTEAVEVMEQLRSSLRGMGFGDRLATAQELVDAFQFDEALVALEPIARSLNVGLKEPA